MDIETIKKNRSLILKKEHFGGIFIDAKKGSVSYLRPEEYSAKENELIRLKESGEKVKLIDVTREGYKLSKDFLSTPNDIFFEITKRCNGACANCFMDANSSKWSELEVSLDDINSIGKEFSRLGGFYLRVTGGEPTVRPDFLEVLDALNEHGLILGLNSNGLFNENMLENIISRGVRDIRVSLDGTKEINERTRGKGTYERVLDTLRNIREYNHANPNDKVSSTINVVMMRSTSGCIEDLIRVSKEYESKISFGMLRLSGRAMESELLTPEEVVSSAYKVHSAREKFGLSQGYARTNFDIFCEGSQDGKGNQMKGFFPYPFDNSKCPLGSSGFALDAYARIVPCGYLVNLEEWIGEDLRGRDFLATWQNSSVLNKAREVNRSSCNGCEYHISKCNGGCPVMAYAFDGDLNGKDPYCVRSVDIKKVIGDKA